MPPEVVAARMSQPVLFDASSEPLVRYFRNCNPQSYYTLVGDRVTYFAPHVPDGFLSENITPAVVLCYAEKQPQLDGEIDLKCVEEIRSAWETTETT